MTFINLNQVHLIRFYRISWHKKLKSLYLKV